MTPYPFTHRGEWSFEFVTNSGTIYNATFFDYDYLFPEFPEFAKTIYSFTLDIVKGDGEHLLDERIGLTVVEIFRNFFKEHQNVMIYVCDSSDDRHFARKKKFDFWFWKYNDGSILKVDSIAVIENVEIYNSLLVHKQNKHVDRIIEAFRSLNERADEK